MNLSKKNILFLTHSYSSFQKDQIEILSQYFRHVYVLVRYKPIAEISRWLPVNLLSIHRKQYVLQLTDKPQNVTVIPVPLYYLPTERGYMKLGEQHFRKTLHIIQQYNISFDLIHAHFIWTAGYVGAKLKEYYNKPLVITSHRNNLSFFKEMETDNLQYYWTISQANTVIRVNKETLSLLKKYNKHTLWISNGFNAKLFYRKPVSKCRDKKNIPSDRIVLLTVGFLENKKGHKYLIKSMQEIIKRVPNALCIIIGGGSQHGQLQKYINSLELQKYVKIVGAVKHEDIPEWVNACDIFVLPSLSESFGIVQLEAMACGKPVVATVNGGSESLITSQDVGLLCEKANPQDLAEKILIALDKSWDADKIREYASQYTLDEVCKKIITAYEDILS